MSIKNFFASQSLKDFLNLFFTNILQKFLGLIRELVIAFFLGSSILYANFLLLRVVADFFSQLTAGNALKANLLPKFTKFYEKHNEVSLNEVFRFSKQTSTYLFFLSQIIQTLVIFHLKLESNLLFFGVSFLLSFSICFNFINTIFLTIFQARGLFLKYSYASVTNSLVFTILVYPLISLGSVIGLAVSRMIGILSAYFSFVKPLRKENFGLEITLNHSDFNLSTLILGNFANIIIISSRFMAGADGSNEITFFMYAVVLLNALLTAVIGNISTILLRNITINKSTVLMTYSLFISIFLGLIMVLVLYFYNNEIVEFVYLRGAFNVYDVEQTASYLYELSFAFLLLFISTILFQPFLSLPINKTKKIRLFMVIIFLLSIFFSIIFSDLYLYTSKESSFLLMYISSAVSVIISIFSFFKYIKYVR